jgi:2-oxoglutarate ferredoxin oxidoreductase subunit gamma
MKKHFEIRFGGSGGQGMMLMGDILAEASGLVENKEILLTKSYGPESRGGACRSELIIDDSPINYPVVTKPDFVLALTQLACDKYHVDMSPDGILLTDPMFVKNPPKSVKNHYALPMTQIAKDVTGKEITANIVAMGAIIVLSDCATIEAVRQTIVDHFPKNLVDINVKAFDAGVAAAKELLK